MTSSVTFQVRTRPVPLDGRVDGAYVFFPAYEADLIGPLALVGRVPEIRRWNPGAQRPQTCTRYIG